MDLKDSKKHHFSLPATIDEFYPRLADAATLTLAVSPADYCASALARAVEDCDAHLLNLNVGSQHTIDGEMIVYIRVSHRNGQAVARSVQRFGYRVVDIRNANDDALDQTARDRVNELLRYLEV